jgi:ADP-heptose:LPS heptosyltransferase
MYARPKLGQPKKIVILRALPLVDLLTAVPAFRALRCAFPDARITLIALPEALDFVKRFGAYLDDFFALPGFPGFPNHTLNVRFCPSFLNTVQKLNFDLAIQMQDASGIANSLVGLLGARVSAGFYQPGSYFPDAQLFLLYPEQETEVRRQLLLMEFMGIPLRGEHLEFPLVAADWKRLQQIKERFNLYKDYVCIHVAAQQAEQGWSTNKFTELADGLAALNYQVVLTGNACEGHRAEAIAGEMETRPIQLPESMEMGVLAALLSQSCLLVSNDMNVSTLAAAVKTPSVVLFSGADPNRAVPPNQHLQEVMEHSPTVTAATVLIRAIRHLEKMQEYA